MIKSITNFLIIFSIFQQLKSQISQIYQNGYNAFCDETLHLQMRSTTFDVYSKWHTHSIMIDEFIMCTFPSSSRHYILSLPRSFDTISRSHLQCTISTTQGAFLCLAAYHGATGNYILNISFTSYQVPIYTPGGHFIKRFVSVFHWQICSQPIRCKDFSSLEQLSVKNTDKTLDEMPPRAESCNVDKLSCWRTNVPGDRGVQIWALITRVRWTHQYTTAPPLNVSAASCQTTFF